MYATCKQNWEDYFLTTNHLSTGLGKGYILTTPFLVPRASSFSLGSYASADCLVGNPWCSTCKTETIQNRMLVNCLPYASASRNQNHLFLSTRLWPAPACNGISVTTYNVLFSLSVWQSTCRPTMVSSIQYWSLFLSTLNGDDWWCYILHCMCVVYTCKQGHLIITMACLYIIILFVSNCKRLLTSSLNLVESPTQ